MGGLGAVPAGAGLPAPLFDTLNRFYVAQEHPDIFARLPSERAPWHAVRHMYEIGRAPENAQHPDHALAQELARGFWATCRIWIRALRHAGARRGREGAPRHRAQAMIESEPFRASLGRIACGYDGGQIVDKDPQT